MNIELAFRALTLLLLVLIIGVSGTFRHRAEQAGKPLRGKGGQGLIAVLRLLSLIVLLPLFGYLVNPAWVDWARIDLPLWLRWLGVAGALAALALSVWVLRSIGTNISPSHATRQGHQLVTHGPYRWVRHPLYSAGTLFYAALVLITGLWVLGLGMLIPLAVLLWRTAREEARLIETFGEEYRAYMRRTGRYLPRLFAR